MPRPVPPTNNVTAYQSSLRVLGSTTDEAQGDAQQIALIRAISKARQAVLMEISALRGVWSGEAVSPGLLPESMRLIATALREMVSVPDTFGLLARTLVRDEQRLALEIAALRDEWSTTVTPMVDADQFIISGQVFDQHPPAFPTGLAGGGLTGVYPNPSVVGEVDNILLPTRVFREQGPAIPIGLAGGGLKGVYPNPEVVAENADIILATQVFGP